MLFKQVIGDQWNIFAISKASAPIYLSAAVTLEAVPRFRAAEAEVVEIAYVAGELGSKVKRLIALAAALKVGCTNCFLAQTEKALGEGATKDEILKRLQELISIVGTKGIVESLWAIKFLDELGHLKYNPKWHF